MSQLAFLQLNPAKNLTRGASDESSSVFVDRAGCVLSASLTAEAQEVLATVENGRSLAIRWSKLAARQVQDLRLTDVEPQRIIPEILSEPVSQCGFDLPAKCQSKVVTRGVAL